MKAHEKAAGKNYTDDTAIFETTGLSSLLVDCGPENIKITTMEDMRMAEKLLGSGFKTRTGTGFDVHAFKDNDKGHIRLCGIDIPHDKSLEGHSDADAALHAVTDALLGAAGEGDIGLHFPPSDPQWKNCDSSVFVKKACELIAQKGGRIINTDLTIICQLPKIGPYRDQMKNRLAEILGVDPSQVNVKATTTEGLGFTGRGEGIAAQAAAAVEFPE
jgi:2-C-methyl-D-erythritol 4-phosphate cytidylyltransferase/2-C-methyl-D-erythritol 2,4-cyclodiphosphate synthase